MMRQLVLSLFLTMLVCCSAIVGQQGAVPTGWTRFERCSFTFLLPENVTEVKKQPIDSCLASFESSDISYIARLRLVQQPFVSADVDARL